MLSIEQKPGFDIDMLYLSLLQSSCWSFNISEILIFIYATEMPDQVEPNNINTS